MKRISLLLILCILVWSLAGCKITFPETTSSGFSSSDSAQSLVSSEPISDLSSSQDVASSTQAPSAVASSQAEVISSQGSPASQSVTSSHAVSSAAAPVSVPSSSQVSAQFSVTLSITGPQGQVLLSPVSVQCEEGTSAFDLLKSYTRQNNIHMEFSGGSSNAYVKGIYNIYMNDYGGDSGWLYRVNGSFDGCAFSSSKYQLKNGDRVDWLYTVDGGKDVGSNF